MKRALVIALLVLGACGGAPGQGFYELAPGRADLATEIADVGQLCDEGGDCTAGMACTNLIYDGHPECELPWSQAEHCPPGMGKMLTATAAPGSTVNVSDLDFTGSFCVTDCVSDADCRHGQHCSALGHFCTRLPDTR